jgi:dGTPase
MIHTVRSTGVIGMDARHGEALAAFRAFNYEAIYLRDASRQQGSAVVGMLRALVEYYSAQPSLIPDVARAELDPARALHEAVEYVAGMTDRYACRRALIALDWPVDRLPSGIDR